MTTNSDELDEFDKLTETARNTPLDDEYESTVDLSVSISIAVIGCYIVFMIFHLFFYTSSDINHTPAQYACGPTITEPSNEQKSP